MQLDEATARCDGSDIGRSLHVVLHQSAQKCGNTLSQVLPLSMDRQDRRGCLSKQGMRAAERC